MAISRSRVIKMGQFWSRKGTGSDTASARHREMMASEDRHRDCSNPAINPGVPGATRREETGRILPQQLLRACCPAHTLLSGFWLPELSNWRPVHLTPQVFQYLCREAVERNTGISADAPGATAMGKL